MLKKLYAYILILFLICDTNAQYYLRGEIKDDQKKPLQNVRIALHSDKNIYFSGTLGGFGISCVSQKDSITLILDGYVPQSIGVSTLILNQIILKSLSSNISKNLKKLTSVSKNNNFSSNFILSVNDESYFSLIENEVIDAQKYPNTGFSLNINKASYSNVRRFLRTKSLVPPDAVRIEELLNYFNLHYREPDKNQDFKIETQISDCPWNAESKLLYLNVNARKLDMINVPPCNLVFLIDASGSMDMPNRLPLVKAAFQMLVKNLRPVDTVSIVAYGGIVTVWLKPTSGMEKQKIIESIEELNAAGDTPGESAIKMAYNLAKQTFIKGGNNRVILATDGDFNVGEASEKALEDLITKERKSGVYLTCLGVGMGNYKDSKLEILAKRGNGNYAYLDDIKEAEKVLVKEVTQTFYSVADDVFLNIHFNPDVIKNYRLIGFDNKRDAIKDTTGELEGGDIGSGNSILSIFEILPTEPIINLNDSIDKIVAQVELKYLTPDNKLYKQLKYSCLYNYISFNELNNEYRLGTAVAMFGMRIRQSKYYPISTDWSIIEKIAKNSYDPTNYLQKQFVDLISIAKKLYPKNRKKMID